MRSSRIAIGAVMALALLSQATLVAAQTARAGATSASALSLATAPSAGRAGAPTGSRKSNLAGGGIGFALLAVIVGGAAYGFIEASNDDDSDSN